MKTFRMIGMALMAVVMCVNFASCSDDDEKPTGNDLSKAIIGTWVQDGDDDVMVITSDGTLTWYDNERDYKNSVISAKYQWKIEGEWLRFYENGELENEARPQKATNDLIVWKDYSLYDRYDEDYPLSDSYGDYRLWTWERYSK